MRRALTVVAATLVTALVGGCGYRDDNPEAARKVAQALLDSYHAGNADAVCRVFGPALLAAAASQGGGNCQPFVQRTFDPSRPALRTGRVVIDHDDTRATVMIDGVPGGTGIGVVKYASVWRVESAPDVLTPR